MANKMLIDAAHPEETRVVVLRNNRVEEFDYESANKKQLRGNIYLAKVTRVEPSLQAAFVDYGGNRHGFLAFSEIHPDYYQIPVADRQALLEEEAEEQSRARDQEELDVEDEDNSDSALASEPELVLGDSQEGSFAEDSGQLDSSQDALTVDLPSGYEAEDDQPVPFVEEPISDEAHLDLISEAISPGPLLKEPPAIEPELVENPEDEPVDDDENRAADDEDPAGLLTDDQIDFDDDAGETEDVESVGSEDALEELPRRSHRRRRSYKIQEVIKRRQIILVQVVKEERGNKGAALTTYMSLAGRYTVLMPNTARGGGISRKITNPTDRKRLRKIAAELKVPEGMGLIIRTAGATRTKSEIKRDFEYLLRLWENVRDFTLQSTAPSLVYEEGNLIKRSIRDLYSREIDEVLVAGDDAYRQAKDFMRMLMPSHAKNVQPYKDPDPLFIKYQIERQLNAMFSPYVTLRSGGYVVINQTEALVAIDVNSGKATREHSIEDTALKTNLEAAEEISRQLRLRDLAGLIVIDFIDMEERRNSRSVERRLKECLRNDRARIQLGRISHFGLLEMSRQRLRTGVLEGSTSQCSHCQGTGMIRSTESVSLSLLRALEDTLQSGGAVDLTANTSVDVAIYVLNQKRHYLKDIERRFGVTISVLASENMHGANFAIERLAKATPQFGDEGNVVQMDWGFHSPDEVIAEEEAEPQKRQRRRKRRSRTKQEKRAQSAVHRDTGEEEIEGDGGPSTKEQEAETQAAKDLEGGQAGEPVKKPRRRGRRGGRRNKPASARGQSINQDDLNGHKRPDAENGRRRPDAELQKAGEIGRTHEEESSAKEDSDLQRPARRMRSRRRSAASRKTVEQGGEGATSSAAADTTAAGQNNAGEHKDMSQKIAAEEQKSDIVRRGWWQRRVQQNG